MKRRTFLLGAAGLAVGGWALKPTAKGASYSPYFAALNESLKTTGPYKPSMLIDLDRLDLNIDAITSAINSPKHFRIVAKSVPSADLIKYVMERANTNRVMVFHQPFINLLARETPNVDMLLGKPLPVQSARQFYQQHRRNPLNNNGINWLTNQLSRSLGMDLPNGFQADQQLQWLVDTPERLGEYLALAQELGETLQINIEIDVGLHRGGITELETLDVMLRTIAANPQQLRFSGFMGYDPHVVKVPSVIASQDELHQTALAKYEQMITHTQAHFPELWRDDLTLNAAGSPTYRLYDDISLVNDLSVGSALMKPTDFDIPTLDAHIPALFIVTPVLKASEGVQIPGSDKVGKLLSWWDPNQKQTFFIYGGYWKAKPENPPGLQVNSVYGRSTNQEMLNGSAEVDISVGDHVFLRPTQSEHVMLQFGDLLTARGGKLLGKWPVFNESA